MNFTSSQIVPGLVHLDFNSLTEMSKSVIRPQEFAESPKFIDQIFTTSQIKKYFQNFKKPTKKHRRGSPYTLFTGFNIPGDRVDEFYRTFPAINSFEREIQEHLNSLELDRYYIIASADKATKKPSWKAGDHEIAHGLWYLDPNYKADQRATIAKLPEKYRKEAADRLLTWGCYAPQVIEDEVHAYLGTDSLSKLSQRFRWHVLADEVIECHDELNARLQQALGKS